ELTRGGAFQLPAAESPLVEACRRSHEFSLEVVFAPSELLQYQGARIVTFSASDKVRNFTLAQQSRDLLFRLHTSEIDEEFLLSRITSTASQHLIVSFGRGRLVAYLNGKPS